MTEPATEPGTEEGRVQSLDERFAEIRRMIEDKLGGGGTADPEPEPEDVKAETRRAVAEVQRREKAKQARDADKARLEGRLSAVEEAVKEKPPREYSRLTNFMRWRGDDDK